MVYITASRDASRAILLRKSLVVRAGISKSSVVQIASPTAPLNPKEAQLARAIDDAKSVPGLINDVVQNGHWDGTTIVIQVKAGAHWDDKNLVDQGKIDIFDIEQELWKHNGFTASSIEVQIITDLVDKYGNSSPGMFLNATLTHDTAHKFNWDNLNPWLDFIHWRDKKGKAG